jgi:hypothetical protein
MKLYHPTKHAAEILRDGFGETSGTYLTETDHSGVWLFDRPAGDHISDDDADVILELEIPESVVAAFEWDVGRPYREFLVPAALVNLYGPPRVRHEHKSGPEQ